MVWDMQQKHLQYVLVAVATSKRQKNVPDVANMLQNFKMDFARYVTAKCMSKGGATMGAGVTIILVVAILCATLIILYGMGKNKQ